jgi:hypothetical protein
MQRWESHEDLFALFRPRTSLFLYGGQNMITNFEKWLIKAWLQENTSWQSRRHSIVVHPEQHKHRQRDKRVLYNSIDYTDGQHQSQTTHRNEEKNNVFVYEPNFNIDGIQWWVHNDCQWHKALQDSTTRLGRNCTRGNTH